MKEKRLLLILTAIAMAAVMLLTACGSKKETTLESYVNDNEDVKTQLEEAVSANEQNGIKIEIQGNDIVYTFDLAALGGFSEELAKDASVKEALEAGMEENADDFKKVASEMTSTTGVEGIKVIVNYVYNDEVVATSTYEADEE